MTKNTLNSSRDIVRPEQLASENYGGKLPGPSEGTEMHNKGHLQTQPKMLLPGATVASCTVAIEVSKRRQGGSTGTLLHRNGCEI